MCGNEWIVYHNWSKQGSLYCPLLFGKARRKWYRTKKVEGGSTRRSWVFLPPTVEASLFVNYWLHEKIRASYLLSSWFFWWTLFSISIEIFKYHAVFEYVTIDTGNKTRTPSIKVTANNYQGALVKKYVGCSIEREFIQNGSLWKYQVARFKFENNINILSHIRLKGTNALLLVGENISIETNGKLQIEPNAIRQLYGESRLVGGFVAVSGGNG